MVKPCAKELKCDVEVGPNSYFLWLNFALDSTLLAKPLHTFVWHVQHTFKTLTI